MTGGSIAAGYGNVVKKFSWIGWYTVYPFSASCASTSMNSLSS